MAQPLKVLKDLLRRSLEEKQLEIYVSHSTDSVAAASMVIRLMSAHGSSAGVSPASHLAREAPEGEALVLGARPPRAGSGVALVKRRGDVSRHGDWILVDTPSSISHEIFAAVSHFYQVPRELRSAAAAGHMGAFSGGLLSIVEDQVVSKLPELFGSDSVLLVEGLKIMGYGSGEPLEQVLENTFDPYLPGITGFRGKGAEILGSLKISQIDSEVLRSVARALNTATGSMLASYGLKPYYHEEHPFKDPYELSLCVSGFSGISPAAVAAYISTGLSGLSQIAYECHAIKSGLAAYLKELLVEKKIKAVTYSIKGSRVTVYPSPGYHLLRPLHHILASLSHYQGYPAYEVEGGYAVPLSELDLAAHRGLDLREPDVAVVKDLQEVPEVARPL